MANRPANHRHNLHLRIEGKNDTALKIMVDESVNLKDGGACHLLTWNIRNNKNNKQQ